MKPVRPLYDKRVASDRSAEWDAAAYHRVSRPQVGWGEEVLARLHLSGDESVIDAGCGTGLVTAALAARVPRGRLTAVDASPAMLEAARETLSAEIAAGRVRLLLGDLLHLSSVVDAASADVVFSTATFHWIDDHARLFREVHACLKPGGRLVAQCGGEGNIDRVIRHGDVVAAREPYSPYLSHLGSWHRRAGAEETADLLRAAGFEKVRAWLTPSPQEFAGRDAFETFLLTVVLGRQRALLPRALHAPYAHDVVDEYERRQGGRYVLDYVRLNIEARRPAG